MLKRKHMIITALTIVFILLGSLFYGIITQAQTGNTETAIIQQFAESEIEYDPLVDVNCDGRIDGLDKIMVGIHLFTEGDPINITEHQYRLDELEARVEALEANYSVTSLKLAPQAIPFNSTYSWTSDTCDSTLDWVDMDNMSVNITLMRTSHLLILFSAVARNPINEGEIHLRVLVNETTAYPDWISFTPGLVETAGHNHHMTFGTYTSNFYKQLVNVGSYTIQIQWRVNKGTGYVSDRTLTVIALPA